MANPEARAWWADVQHLREVHERTDEARRRADLADADRRPSADRRRAATQAPRERRPSETRASAAPRERRPADAGTAAASSRRDEHAAGTPLGERRTIEIRGRPVPAPAVPRSVDIGRHRPPRRALERVGHRPDRLALWALLMGLLLILVAVGTADASILPR